MNAVFFFHQCIYFSRSLTERPDPKPSSSNAICAHRLSIQIVTCVYNANLTAPPDAYSNSPPSSSIRIDNLYSTHQLISNVIPLLPTPAATPTFFQIRRCIIIIALAVRHHVSAPSSPTSNNPNTQRKKPPSTPFSWPPSLHPNLRPPSCLPPPPQQHQNPEKKPFFNPFQLAYISPSEFSIIIDPPADLHIIPLSPTRSDTCLKNYYFFLAFSVSDHVPPPSIFTCIFLRTAGSICTFRPTPPSRSNADIRDKLHGSVAEMLGESGDDQIVQLSGGVTPKSDFIFRFQKNITNLLFFPPSKIQLLHSKDIWGC